MDAFLNATVDAALALGFFVTAAEAAGLGAAPLSSLRDNIDAVADILGMPAGVFPIAGVMACLLYTSPSPRDLSTSRMPSSA